ncbi:ComEC family competence protein [Novosphingobium sp. 1949]|uniref:ComEC family competence protein n=1 Tax=Novosphingobium organovorum TaxID=2930092 RepID=A0ABT0B7Y9_9SPHN|nr:ComEC/Rec2 family competence protein [Novosphingobium organovorum]MCJ2181123.1 ComEC family competence protein [Novosphingobium organovorum]
MASEAAKPDEKSSPDMSGCAALRRRQWNSESNLSRALAGVEGFLSKSGHDRAPWLCVAFGTGILAWFTLPLPLHWVTLTTLCIAASLAAHLCWRRCGAFPYVSQALFWVPLLLAAGCLLVWARSEISGTRPIRAPLFGTFTGRLLAVEEQSALGRRRLFVAIREPGGDRAIKVRLNLADAPTTPSPVASGSGDGASQGAGPLTPGSLVRFKARLMPPAAAMVPGGYNFARTAWFSGLAASGAVLGRVEVLEPGQAGGSLAGLRRSLSRHVRARMPGGAGGIGAALVSGDRGGIGTGDAQAMRDAGLAHLLSISGLHVSAVIALAYMVAIRLLALWPALALRVRLPVLASAMGALAGVSYTVLTGAQVPTVRSCVGALLVLMALAIGREPLSLRMLAIAAFVVLALWPEAIIGPSFQMSFAAVLALVSLSTCAPVRAFVAAREEGVLARLARWFAMLLVTGLVIDLALMPITLYHFHRAGFYGAFANIVAIPMTTFVIMPGIALGLAADLFGLGVPVWWLVERAIDTILALAHFVASRPGAVTVIPAIGGSALALFALGGVWVGLWRGQVRLLGLGPALAGLVWLALLPPPDILVGGDGRHVGIVERGSRKGTADRLVLLRESRSSYVRDNLLELAGMQGDTAYLPDQPGARCTPDFCTLVLERGGKAWTILVSRSRNAVPERALAATCDRVDIVIADRWLPQSCRPRWLKADRAMLVRTGGLSIDLSNQTLRTVAEGQGKHGWWRPYESGTGMDLPLISAKVF